MSQAVGTGDGRAGRLTNGLGLDKELAKSVNVCHSLSRLHVSLVFSSGIKYMGFMPFMPQRLLSHSLGHGCLPELKSSHRITGVLLYFPLNGKPSFNGPSPY